MGADFGIPCVTLGGMAAAYPSPDARGEMTRRHGWERVLAYGPHGPAWYAVALDDCRVRHRLADERATSRELASAFRAWADANPRDGETG